MTDQINPEQTLKPTQPIDVEPKGKAKERKYLYKGKVHKNPKVFLLAGNRKIRPWSMTDDEIDKLLITAPQLAKLWERK